MSENLPPDNELGPDDRGADEHLASPATKEGQQNIAERVAAQYHNLAATVAMKDIDILTHRIDHLDEQDARAAEHVEQLDSQQVNRGNDRRVSAREAVSDWRKTRRHRKNVRRETNQYRDMQIFHKSELPDADKAEDSDTTQPLTLAERRKAIIKIRLSALKGRLLPSEAADEILAIKASPLDLEEPSRKLNKKPQAKYERVRERRQKALARHLGQQAAATNAETGSDQTTPSEPANEADYTDRSAERQGPLSPQEKFKIRQQADRLVNQGLTPEVIRQKLLSDNAGVHAEDIESVLPHSIGAAQYWREISQVSRSKPTKKGRAKPSTPPQKDTESSSPTPGFGLRPDLAARLTGDELAAGGAAAPAGEVIAESQQQRQEEQASKDPMQWALEYVAGYTRRDVSDIGPALQESENKMPFTRMSKESLEGAFRRHGLAPEQAQGIYEQLREKGIIGESNAVNSHALIAELKSYTTSRSQDDENERGN